MNRSKQAGFSFIEILVVMGIISVLVSMVVVVVPMIQERAKRAQSTDNLRSLYLFMQSRVTAKGWKTYRYSGKNFTLSPVALGDLDRREKANLRILFSPGDPIRGIEGVELDDYKAITPKSLKRGDEGFENLTSYAGRRNADPDFMITSSDESKGTLILADDDDGPVHHVAGFVACYSNGRVEFFEWNQFDLIEPEDDKNPTPWLGEEAGNEDLRALSSH